jgi:hypothetical protein
MDAPDPAETRLVLSSRTPGRKAQELVWEGDWDVLVFATGPKAYVLRQFATVGAWRGIVAVRYLSESGASKESRAVGEQFFAVTDVASSEGNSVAFVAQTKTPAVATGFHLYVLDVVKDSLRDLGRPPAPPPVDPDASDALCRGKGAVSWGDSELGGAYTPMDDGILVFEPGVLKVSFGADTCARRAAKRTIRTIPLGPLTLGAK